MDYLSLALVWLGGFLLGHQWAILRLQKVLRQYAKENGIHLEGEPKPSMVVCVVEFENQQYYLYDKNTNSFYCQASSLEDLALALYKDKKIDQALVVETYGNSQKFWLFKNGKSEPAKLNEG